MPKDTPDKGPLLKGVPNIPDGHTGDLGKEYREWLKVQHPDDYENLLAHEKEYAESKTKKKPAPPETPQAPAPNPPVNDSVIIQPQVSGPDAPGTPLPVVSSLEEAAKVLAEKEGDSDGN